MAGQPSLSQNAMGSSLSFFIRLASATYSSSVFGA